MKKLFLLLMFFTSIIFGQIADEGYTTFADSNLSAQISLGNGFALTEIYLDTTYTGTSITLYAGDNLSESNFVPTYYDGDILTFTVTETPCRISFTPAKTTGTKRWKIKSTATETCTIGWKSVFLAN